MVYQSQIFHHIAKEANLFCSGLLVIWFKKWIILPGWKHWQQCICTTSHMLILHESCTNVSGFLVVYAPVFRVGPGHRLQPHSGNLDNPPMQELILASQRSKSWDAN